MPLLRIFQRPVPLTLHPPQYCYGGRAALSLWERWNYRARVEVPSGWTIVESRKPFPSPKGRGPG